MIKNIVFAAAITVALAGCESLYRAAGMSTPPPDPKNPKVWVMTKQGCEAPYILVAPEPLYIYKPGNGQTVTIIWHLQTPGYSFATPAQTPTPLAGSSQNEISCPSASGNNMTCIDKVANPGSWKYKIAITADSSGPCPGMSPPVLDPTISND